MSNPPRKKRTLTNSDEIQIPTQLVPYEAYTKMVDHVLRLTKLVNQLRAGLIESGQAKLCNDIASSCEELPEPELLGAPFLLPTSCQPSDVFPNLSSLPPVVHLSPPTIPASASSDSPPKPVNALDIAREAAKLIDKSTRVVVERMADDKDNKEQDAKDLDFFRKLATGNNLPCPTKVHRHQCASRSRPLKLQFDSSTDRDTFLTGFSRIRHSDSTITSLPTKIRARRDLTQSELETLRNSRKFVYDENKKAGMSIYIISDINFKRNNKPRPFV